MEQKKNKKRITAKIALMLGVVLLVLWGVLGTGASLAWFTDEDVELKNVFNFAEFDMELEYKNHNMDKYEPVDLDTNIFAEDALYEPGYTQLVYLKVKNVGEAEFKYKLSLDVRDYTLGKNIFGGDIYLPDHLRYGVLFSDSDEGLTRALAQESAKEKMEFLKLNTYTLNDEVVVAPGEERYVAVVVYMPESVDNVANFRGDVVPEVKLGVTVFAHQLGMN